MFSPKWPFINTQHLPRTWFSQTLGTKPLLGGRDHEALVRERQPLPSNKSSLVMES